MGNARRTRIATGIGVPANAARPRRSGWRGWSEDAPLWLIKRGAGLVYAVTMPFVAITAAYVYFDARVRGELDQRDVAELPAEIELAG